MGRGRSLAHDVPPPASYFLTRSPLSIRPRRWPRRPSGTSVPRSCPWAPRRRRSPGRPGTAPSWRSCTRWTRSWPPVLCAWIPSRWAVASVAENARRSSLAVAQVGQREGKEPNSDNEEKLWSRRSLVPRLVRAVLLWGWRLLCDSPQPDSPRYWLPPPAFSLCTNICSSARTLTVGTWLWEQGCSDGVSSGRVLM